MKTRLRPATLAVLSLLALTVQTHAHAQAPSNLKTQVAASVNAAYPWLDGVYKDLHAHPELAFQEVRTAGKLAAEMRKLGFEVTTGEEGVRKLRLVLQ